MPQSKNISITPGGQKPVINVSQNDVGRVVVLNVTDGTEWYDLTGTTTVLVGMKPSGLGYSVAATVSGHTATITTTKQMTDEHGQIESELRITKGNTVLGTINMVLNVERDPHPDGTTDGSVDELIPEITVLVERAETAAAGATSAATRAASSATSAATSAEAATESAAEIRELIHDLTTPMWFDSEGYLCF